MDTMEWRTKNPKLTLSRVAPLLSRIHTTPPLDISFTDTLGIPVHLTIRSTFLHAVEFQELKEWGQLEISYTHCGKGLTTEQSRLSCIMEAIERYSASCHSLKGRSVVAPYAEMAVTTPDPREFFLPEGVVFSPETPITWYQAMDVISSQRVSMPIDMVLLNIPDSAYPFPGFETKRLGFHFSNGLAAGVTLEEALVAGICEIVERDAQYRIALGIGPEPVEIDLEGDSDLRFWKELFERNRLGLRIFFLCNAPGFYSAVAAGWDRYCRILVTGTASDPDLRIATQRAILELVQQRAFLFFCEWKSRREYFPIVRYIREKIHPEAYRTEVPSSFWTERCAAGPIPIDQAGKPHSRDLNAILTALCDAHRVICFDLTHPQLEIPVVRVIISHMKNGYLHYRPALAFLKEEAVESASQG